MTTSSEKYIHIYLANEVTKQLNIEKWSGFIIY